MMPKTEQNPLPDPVLETVLAVWERDRKQHTIPIAGNSMLPLIRNGDRVLVIHGSAGVQRGDVVVFRREGHMIAHRVLRVCDGADGPTFFTKGDNALHLDPPLSASEIVGRVLAIERSGRHMSLNTATWRMFGWLTATGALIWAKLYSWGRTLKRRLLGSGPNRVTASVRRFMLALYSLPLRVAHALFCRWKA